MPLDAKKLQRKLDKLKRYAQKDAPRTAGTEAVKYFQDAFHNEKWEGRSWQKSKRKDSNSQWYGFEHDSRVKLPSNHPRRKGIKGAYKPRKTNAITNYSPAATKRKTLSGKTGDLKDSIQYRVQRGRVIVYSDQPYAQVHNYGGTVRVFGKKLKRMPRRQFIGRSPKLNQIIKREIKRDINKILK